MIFRGFANMIIPGAFFIANEDITMTKIFYAAETSAANSTDFQLWEKPVGARLVQIWALSGGGGGGSGQSAAVGNPRAGGGGGASGAQALALYYGPDIPDLLWVKVGIGGSGGASGATGSGTDGQVSYVSIRPTTQPGDQFILSGFNTSGAGINGATNGNGGGAPSAANDAIFSSAAITKSRIGIGGTNGGTGTSPGADGATYQVTGTTIMPGTGGGSTSTTNVDHLGGAYNTLFTATWFEQNMPMPAGAGVNGRNGFSFLFQTRYAQVSFGGQGGNSNANGQAGNGGDGSFGAGGGGGGGGVTGGNGGRGGPGLVVITCWS